MSINALAANAAALPDRRRLLGSAALAAAVSATAALPAVGAEAASPVEIAYGVWIEASKARSAAIEAVWNIEGGLYEAPERPRYDHVKSWGDYETVFLNPEGTRGRSYCKTDDANVAKLEAIIAGPFDPSRGDPGSVDIGRFTHGRRIDQAKATLAQVVAYRAEAKRRADACGLTAAREHEEACEAVAIAARDAMLALPTITYRDAAFLAALIEDDDRVEDVDRLLAELRRLAGIPSFGVEA